MTKKEGNMKCSIVQIRTRKIALRGGELENLPFEPLRLP